MNISLDTETTGIDLNHGARPFLVTVCDDIGQVRYWEWDVDYETREVKVPKQDIHEIREVIYSAHSIHMQNPRFDVRALESIGVIDIAFEWNWSKVDDTLLAGHLLASNQPHDLTTMALVYLGVNIKPYEDAVEEAVKEARRIAKAKYPSWKIARAGLDGMPSAKDSTWKYDMALPRAIAQAEKYDPLHPWWVVTAEYANADSTVTMPLFVAQHSKICDRGLDKIYEERRKLLPIVHQMERHGITVNVKKAEQLKKIYTESSSRSESICIGLAKPGTISELPINGTSNSIKEVLFDQFGLNPIKLTAKGAPSLDKYVLDEWVETLPQGTPPQEFVKHLRSYRKRKTAISYIESYEKYWIESQGYARMYPSLNPTGTHTLRFSSQNPNEQQISKQEIIELTKDGQEESHTARDMFGPLPGEEWWSCDAQNIELRLPAYEAGEQVMIDLFERPDDPPYYGSNHLLAFDILHPEKFAQHGKNVKKVYADTWYQWTKNGNFAVQYGAVAESGTADRAYHVKGAQALIEQRLGKIKQLSQRCIQFAEKYGYVETIPDKTVDPKRGYPLLCTRTKWGKIMPTVPLSYHIQGTAMWWMMKAMIRVGKFLDLLNGLGPTFRRTMGREKTVAEQVIGYHMIMQVHDELVFKFPKGHGEQPWKTNRPIMTRIQELMAEGGNDIGIPTPVSCEYHASSWGKGISV